MVYSQGQGLRAKVDDLYKRMLAAEAGLLALGLPTGEMKSKLHDLQVGISEARCTLDELDAKEETDFGIRLIELGNELEARRGGSQGTVFERYEMAKEHEKIELDARVLYRTWMASASAPELELALEGLSFETMCFGLGSRRLVRHYEGVKASIS